MNRESTRTARRITAVLGAGVLAAPAAAQCVTWANGPFTTASYNSIDALAQMGSRLVVGGDFQATTATGGQAVRIAAWDGVDVTAFGSGMNGTVRALKVYTAGSGIFATTNLVAGGSFTTAGGTAANRIAIWSESSIIAFPPPAWAPLGAGFNGTVNAIERFNNQVYAAGSFTASGATAVSRIARYNSGTQSWEPLGTGLNGTAYALKVHNGALYVGGTFTAAGGVSTGALARWDGSSWSQVGGTFGGSVYALESFTPPSSSAYLMVGGSWGGSSPNLTAWAGDTYVNLIASGGTNGPIYAFFAEPGTRRLYAAGAFTIITGRGCGNTAVLTFTQGGGWDPLLGGTDTDVRAIHVFHNEVIAGGLFSTAGGVLRPRIARFFPTGAPWVARQPVSLARCRDGVTFSCLEARGYESGAAFHWQRNGVPLSNGPTGTGSVVSGATSRTLAVLNAGNADEGSYRCIVSNSCGSEATSSATLVVCAGDRDCSGVTDPADVSAFVAEWLASLEGGTTGADFDGNGQVDPADVSRFVATWYDELGSGC